ncbi:sporulation histidine kinase inhibitor Sda [Cohnella nanjingensis]|uniref:sporulation histidine kinase inhibitor Sda n=1 Tax=Cohnella nanjingensis TaxID=1387779 RepID=UPI001FE39083|nr:sporulation histidine kinase inhibitor Sda [Cohnella nanjingensis]
MNQHTHSLHLVPRPLSASEMNSANSGNDDPSHMIARNLKDKASLLRPLKDEHLLEVYREAKKMNLSSEFIELLEDAIELRNLEHRLKA